MENKTKACLTGGALSALAAVINFVEYVEDGQIVYLNWASLFVIAGIALLVIATDK